MGGAVFPRQRTIPPAGPSPGLDCSAAQAPGLLRCDDALHGQSRPSQPEPAPQAAGPCFDRAARIWDKPSNRPGGWTSPAIGPNGTPTVRVKAYRVVIAVLPTRPSQSNVRLGGLTASAIEYITCGTASWATWTNAPPPAVSVPPGFRPPQEAQHQRSLCRGPYPDILVHPLTAQPSSTLFADQEG